MRVAARLAELAARHGRTLPQLAIAWVVGHPAVSVALVGMRNDRELVQNVASTEWRLSVADSAAIDRIFSEENCPTYADYPAVHGGLNPAPAWPPAKSRPAPRDAWAGPGWMVCAPHSGYSQALCQAVARLRLPYYYRGNDADRRPGYRPGCQPVYRGKSDPR